MEIRAHNLGAGRGEGLGGALGGVETGVKTQRGSAVDVATSRGNSEGFTAASSQYPETNFLDSVKGAQVEPGNNVSNLIVEVRVVVPATTNMYNVKTTIVSTRRGIRKTMNGYQTTFTSSSSPSHKGVGARRRGGNRVTHREKIHL